jgi:hypothetical protein
MPVQCDRLTMAGPAEYRVRVQGVVERSWVDQSTRMKVSYRNVGRADAVTVLTGDVLDQAELIGLLNHLYSLGAPLVSIQWRPSKVAQVQQPRSGGPGKVGRERTQRKAPRKSGITER